MLMLPICVPGMQTRIPFDGVWNDGKPAIHLHLHIYDPR